MEVSQEEPGRMMGGGWRPLGSGVVTGERGRGGMILQERSEYCGSRAVGL